MSRPIVVFCTRSYQVPYSAWIFSNTDRWISTHAEPVPAQRTSWSGG
jgi:hypothetical protein